jgi:hypothetical protein
MLDPHATFEIANALALAGWTTLCLSPMLPRRAVTLVAGTMLPVLLSLAYCALVLAFWSGAPGGFESLEAVMALFTMPEIALAGWLHYLAFDLLVGVAITRAARDEAIAFVLVLPCLGLAFLFGPAGFLAFDLLVGVAITRAARDEAIAFVLVLPCLGLAFLFGPAGFLAFAALRWTRVAARAAALQETRP